MHHQKFRPPAGAHEKSSFTTQRPPYQQRGPRPQAVPEQPKAMASALRVKNYRLLLNEVGEENLAVALDLTLHRVKELSEGINFSNETTHHIETTLGLNSGFLDQVNPTLTASDVERIKSSPSAHYEEDTGSSNLGAPSAQPAVEAPSLNVAESASSPAASTPVFTEIIANKELSMSQTSTHAAEAVKPVMPAEDLAQLRRQNFQTLTSRSGAKTAMARVTGLSPANISHRLHGNKIFDANEAAFFCEKLGLPSDWFEAPRTEDDVPEATYVLLGLQNVASKPQGASKGPKGPRKTKVLAVPPLAATQSEVGLSPVAMGKAATSSSANSTQGAIATSSLGSKAPAASLSPAQAPSVESATTSAPASQSIVEAHAAPAMTPPPVVLAPAPAVMAAQPGPAFAASTLLATDGQGVGPIAEALIRTLASKSRAGALSEDRALQLLIDVAAL